MGLNLVANGLRTGEEVAEHDELPCDAIEI